MSKWKMRIQFRGNLTRIFDRANSDCNIKFITYFNESTDCSISRLDLRCTKSETTLIIEPSCIDVRNQLMEVLDAGEFTIDPNVLSDDQAIRVHFKNLNAPKHEKINELVAILVNQERSLSEIYSTLLSHLNQSLRSRTLGLVGVSLPPMFHDDSKSSSTSASDYLQTGNTHFGKTQ